jgi:hypothetical protein
MKFFYAFWSPLVDYTEKFERLSCTMALHGGMSICKLNFANVQWKIIVSHKLLFINLFCSQSLHKQRTMPLAERVSSTKREYLAFILTLITLLSNHQQQSCHAESTIDLQNAENIVTSEYLHRVGLYFTSHCRKLVVEST